MAPCRYKTLMSYLPGMASVVNAFAAPTVQQAVFDELMKALNHRMEQEGVPPTPRSSVRSVAELKSLVDQVSTDNGEELALELESGDSIHAVSPKG